MVLGVVGFVIAAMEPSAEPAIFLPESKQSDRSESADGESYLGRGGGVRGREVPRSAGAYDTMGVGVEGGSVSRYGSRTGGVQADPSVFKPVEQRRRRPRVTDLKRGGQRPPTSPPGC
jgi:hypothetical protein